MKSEQEWRMAEKRGDRHKDNEGGRGTEGRWAGDVISAGEAADKAGPRPWPGMWTLSRGPGSIKAEKLRRKTSHPVFRAARGPPAPLATIPYRFLPIVWAAHEAQACNLRTN